jgi:hypothetical protein
MFRWLETFGRYSLDVHGSGIDGDAVFGRMGPLYEHATRDRAGFLAALRDVVADDRGGFATYGAARLVWEMYSDEALRVPEALALIDAGIEFKTSRGLPTFALTGYEWERLRQLRSAAG